MTDPEHYRPSYHFTPPQNWMNDPNGLVVLDGDYHLYYQHNPHGTEWGHMSWGHAVSQDLVTWTHLPLAIPEEPADGFTIFSGSAVLDRANTSGLGSTAHPPLVAIYTADYRDRHLEDIHIAFSGDRGRTFAQYDQNPVIAIGQPKFGDPKVFWHVASQRWILVAICGHEQGHVVFYSSPDLKHWAPLSEFHAPDDAPHVWECPDLFPLPVDGDPSQIKWVLKTNWVKPGGGRSGTCYFVGDFDGMTFTQAIPTGQSLTAPDGALYAEVTYNDAPDDRRILMGWLRQAPHPLRPWTGAQAIPRLLSLRTSPQGLALCQTPLPALQERRGLACALEAQRVRAGDQLPVTSLDLSRRALEIELAFEAPGAGECGLRLDLADGSWATMGYDADRAMLALAHSSGRYVTSPFAPDDALVWLRVFLDQDIVELFANEMGGLTAYLPFGVDYERLSFYARGTTAALRSLVAWTLA